MKITITDIKKRKKGRKILALTAYDYTFAKILDQAGVDILLVGDSVGMVCHGDKHTQDVTIEQMIYHTEGVARAREKALVVSDLPFETYNNPQCGVVNAKKLINAGADAVKIEDIGNIVEVVESLVAANIPVVGHVGLTPQSAESFKVVGRETAEAKRIINTVTLLEKAGVFAIVLECIPSKLAEEITTLISIPTIGIGAGRACDGQVLVSYDTLGLFLDFRPRFVRHFLEGATLAQGAVKKLKEAIENGTFPSDKESFL